MKPKTMMTRSKFNIQALGQFMSYIIQVLTTEPRTRLDPTSGSVLLQGLVPLGELEQMVQSL